MKSRMKMLLLGCAASLMLAAAPAGAQGDWPSRSFRIVSPYGAGGPNDLAARLIGEELGKRLGQSVVVENKVGAGTAIGNHYVAKAPADGYTLLFAAAPYSTLEALNGKLSYDPNKDLLPVAKVAAAPLFLIVNADSPYKTVQDLVRAGSEKPEGLTMGSPGHGSLPHLSQELFLRDAGVKGVVVQYKGDVAAYTDLIAGRLDATLTAITAALPHIEAGKLRVLGVASEQPSAIYPDAKPLKDQGLANVVASGWYGFMVPAGTDQASIDRLDKEINEILQQPEVKQRMLSMGLEITAGDQKEFQRFIQSEMQKWAGVIKDAGIKAQ
ncbi:MAG TPA: tripartite tricarboxylate transporter substrate binding protein [Burkholderiaceae bacterium]|nr:tripartite tricarboxylate transporter substrate binding protein [Burkholderiaceae bacterium]